MKYNSSYYEKMYERNSKVAQAIMPFLIERLKPSSIVDIGCGRGIFLAEAMKQGINDILGVDGDYIERDKLYIPQNCFMGYDLNKKLSVDRKFDIAMSFEVAEHIEKSNERQFVSDLVELSDIVAFSAAIPGQGGKGHVNEQWMSCWNELFMEHAYYPINRLKFYFWNNNEITPLRRQNIILFVSSEKYEQTKAIFNDFDENVLLDVVHPRVYEEKMRNNIFKIK